MNQNFIKVNQNQLDVDIDLKYASKNNFTGDKVYLSESCFLHKIAFEHLCIAVDIAKKLGLKIKIFDAYRPTYVQKNYGIHYQTQTLLLLQKKVLLTQEVLQLT